MLQEAMLVCGYACLCTYNKLTWKLEMLFEEDFYVSEREKEIILLLLNLALWCMNQGS